MRHLCNGLLNGFHPAVTAWIKNHLLTWDTCTVNELMANARFAEGVLERTGKKPKPPGPDPQVFLGEDVFFQNENIRGGFRGSKCYQSH